jgi:hypothetical protein
MGTRIAFIRYRILIAGLSKHLGLSHSPTRDNATKSLPTRLLILASASILLFGLETNAQIYRWVDDDGQTHFSSHPPPEKASSVEQYHLEVTPPSSTKAPAPPPPKHQSDEERQAEAIQQAEAQQTAIKEREARSQTCAKGKKYKEILGGNTSRRFKQTDGSYRPLTDEERATEMARAEKAIADHCR